MLHQILWRSIFRGVFIKFIETQKITVKHILCARTLLSRKFAMPASRENKDLADNFHVSIVKVYSDWEGKGPCAIVPLTWKMAHKSLCRMIRNGPLKISKSLKKAENGPFGKNLFPITGYREYIMNCVLENIRKCKNKCFTVLKIHPEVPSIMHSKFFLLKTLTLETLWVQVYDTSDGKPWDRIHSTAVPLRSDTQRSNLRSGRRSPSAWLSLPRTPPGEEAGPTPGRGPLLSEGEGSVWVVVCGPVKVPFVFALVQRPGRNSNILCCSIYDLFVCLLYTGKIWPFLSSNLLTNSKLIELFIKDNDTKLQWVNSRLG